MVSNRIESKRNESSQSHRATRPKYAVNNSQLCDAFEFRTRTLGGGNVCLVYSAVHKFAIACAQILMQWCVHFRLLLYAAVWVCGCVKRRFSGRGALQVRWAAVKLGLLPDSGEKVQREIFVANSIFKFYRYVRAGVYGFWGCIHTYMYVCVCFSVSLAQALYYVASLQPEACAYTARKDVRSTIQGVCSYTNFTNTTNSVCST